MVMFVGDPHFSQKTSTCGVVGFDSLCASDFVFLGLTVLGWNNLLKSKVFKMCCAFCFSRCCLVCSGEIPLPIFSFLNTISES